MRGNGITEDPTAPVEKVQAEPTQTFDTTANPNLDTPDQTTTNDTSGTSTMPARGNGGVLPGPNTTGNTLLGNCTNPVAATVYSMLGTDKDNDRIVLDHSALPSGQNDEEILQKVKVFIVREVGTNPLNPYGKGEYIIDPLYAENVTILGENKVFSENLTKEMGAIRLSAEGEFDASSNSLGYGPSLTKLPIVSYLPKGSTLCNTNGSDFLNSSNQPVANPNVENNGMWIFNLPVVKGANVSDGSTTNAGKRVNGWDQLESVDVKSGVTGFFQLGSIEAAVAAGGEASWSYVFPASVQKSLIECTPIETAGNPTFANFAVAVQAQAPHLGPKQGNSVLTTEVDLSTGKIEVTGLDASFPYESEWETLLKDKQDLDNNSEFPPGWAYKLEGVLANPGWTDESPTTGVQNRYGINGGDGAIPEEYISECTQVISFTIPVGYKTE